MRGRARGEEEEEEEGKTKGFAERLLTWWTM